MLSLAQLSPSLFYLFISNILIQELNVIVVVDDDDDEELLLVLKGFLVADLEEHHHIAAIFANWPIL